MNIYLVDAFASKPFTGNPAAVLILDSEPTDTNWMRSVAADMNQSETCFVWPLTDNDKAEWGLRWFTPITEIELCGHATLASAHVLWSTGLVDEDKEVRFFTPYAKHYLQCALDKDNSADSSAIRMSFPARSTEPAKIPDGLVGALGASPTDCGRCDNGSLLLQFSTAEEIRSMRPDFRKLQKCTEDVVIVTALSDQVGMDVISRFFAPGKGLDEDPVTGSAHCIIGPWWSKPLKQQKMVCYQASKRGGVLNLELRDDRVYISGKAVTVLQGDWLITPQSM